MVFFVVLYILAYAFQLFRMGSMRGAYSVEKRVWGNFDRSFINMSLLYWILFFGKLPMNVKIPCSGRQFFKILRPCSEIGQNDEGIMSTIEPGGLIKFNLSNMNLTTFTSLWPNCVLNHPQHCWGSHVL